MVKYLAVFIGCCLVAIYAFRKDMPTATCKDGTVSYSKHKSGTCSNHGGVLEWK